MVRSAIAGMIAAALAAAPSYGQVQSQPQTPDYPYQEPKRAPTGEVVRNVIQDALDAAARAKQERRQRERERREWELRQQQQQVPPPQSYEPPVAVAPVPEPSSPPDPALNPEPAPVTAATRPVLAKPVTPKAVPAAQLASMAPKPKPAQKIAPIADQPVATPLPADAPEPAPPVTTESPPVVAQAPAPVARKVASNETRLSPLSRWWPIALLALGIAAAGGGWSVRQRRARLARTRNALSLASRLDQGAGIFSTTPIKLAAPRVSIRTRLQFS